MAAHRKSLHLARPSGFGLIARFPIVAANGRYANRLAPERRLQAKPRTHTIGPRAPNREVAERGHSFAFSLVVDGHIFPLQTFKSVSREPGSATPTLLPLSHSFRRGKRERAARSGEAAWFDRNPGALVISGRSRRKCAARIRSRAAIDGRCSLDRACWRAHDFARPVSRRIGRSSGSANREFQWRNRWIVRKVVECRPW
jgi:hypothetical protein